MTKETPTDPAQPFVDAVIKASDTMEALLKGGLNKKAIIILLCHQTKLSQRDVKKVLEELPKLKKNFCS